MRSFKNDTLENNENLEITKHLEFPMCPFVNVRPSEFIFADNSEICFV